MNSISAILLKEHPIDGCVHDGNGNLKPFPILAIDEVPLNTWISKNTSFSDSTSLVPAQGWLYDHQDDFALSNVWKLLKPRMCESDAVSTVIPILICPDDLDLVCSVIMVEQISTQSEVKWIRFGQAWGNTHGIVTSVIWENNFSSPSLTFKFTNFEEAYNDLKHLDEVWSE
ncbi:hypothetical protein SAMN05421749_11068 [Acinetobacter marinus]|uniref:Ypar31 protein n=1 Tax=Acinetobacter marinus TaxID=281375 RepID=A0A1G6NP98_9GAMM|nr:hypothetical protein [Acinetobacter marinus]SDC69780.1 hypothetical protein SAMN05421749_11068 [Acinetobacter marinus]